MRSLKNVLGLMLVSLFLAISMGGCTAVAAVTILTPFPSAEITQTAPAVAKTQVPAPSPTETPAVPSASPAAKSGGETLTMLFAGDVMAHEKQLRCHKFGAEYDFTADYKYIRGIISKADISVVNLETVLGGETPYSGLPPFNSPDSLADALKYGGFNVIGTANNHIRDRGDDGMKRTSEVLRGKGFTVIGTAGTKDETKYALVEKNGIKVGLVNFTVSINRGIPASAEDYVDCLRRSNDFKKGLKNLGSEIDLLKKYGAEFIAVYMHWGTEYTEANDIQKNLAHSIADMGADLIVGSHPHILQGVDEYESPKTRKEVLIYYSLGNFDSNQGYTYGTGSGNCETGALALIKLKRLDDGSVAIDSAGYLTTYMHKPNIKTQYTEDGRTHEICTTAYYIVPASDAAANPSLYEGAAGALLEHIRQGVINGEDIIGAPGIALQFFDFKEYTSFPWE